MNADRYEIRPIDPKTVASFRLCSKGILCTNIATHYLVRKPQPPHDQRESRQLRCEAHAQEDAKGLRIPFPGENQK